MSIRKPQIATPQLLAAFQGPEHQPFLWPGGRPAALLVHGFPGTPAEMRPLGEALHQAGWTVQGLLLPGFGPQIATLGERRYEDWTAAIVGALRGLQREHSPVLLVGYSMGAALAVGVAADYAPHGLILLAPFWRSGSPLQQAIGALLRPFLPRSFRPLQRADFSNPQVRQFVANFFPQADLDDLEIQAGLRGFSVPVSLVDQVRIAGRSAYGQAATVHVPLLIVQGAQDEVVKPAYTRHLARRFPHVPRYLEVNAGHDLIKPVHADWPTIAQAVLEFAASLQPSPSPSQEPVLSKAKEEGRGEGEKPL